VDRKTLDQTLDLVQEALGDRYLVTGPLAQGGMSLLLRGRQTLLDQPVAIKVMNANMVGNRELRERFLREARILASLQVPQITRVYDAGALKDGRLYLVLELLQGENLELISERGPLSIHLAARLLMQVCDGLIAAHDRGIIHRDLKPENVFIVTAENGEPVAKLLDFGIAKDTADEQDVTGTFTIVGSPLYVPPEQIVSSRTVDKRADIWAMGIMLYQLVLQRHPFEDPSLALLLNKIQNEPLPPFPQDSDPMFELIVERCLAKKPEKRYQTAIELKEALANLAEGGEPLDDLDDLPTIGPRPAPIRSQGAMGMGIGELATERPPPSLDGRDGGNGSPQAPQRQAANDEAARQRPATVPLMVALPSPPQQLPQQQNQLQPAGAPPQQPGGRTSQKTIPLGRALNIPPAPTPEPPRSQRGLTAPLMQAFQLPQTQPHQAQSAPRRPEAPQFAEPPPAMSRRQAPTVLVAREGERPMWPFVAFGVAIVLAVVAVALVVTR
jgi:serine/threonine protein kinase